jgi:uncharacterized protein (TIGR02145 family)
MRGLGRQLIFAAAMIAVAVIGTLWLSERSKKSAPETASETSDTLIDSRDGRRYRTVVIGGNRWMAENLNYQPLWGKSWCYDKDNSNCDKYGRLYDWKTAKTVCPTGWILPDTADWNWLEKTVGSDEVAGKNLKAHSGWYKNGNGTDNYGFSALPSGYRDDYGHFLSAVSNGVWWTVTENGSNAYDRNIYYGDNVVDAEYNGKGYGFSVRCIADTP